MSNTVAKRVCTRKRAIRKMLTPEQCRKRKDFVNWFFHEIAFDPQFGDIHVMHLEDGTPIFAIRLLTVCKKTGLLPDEIVHAIQRRGSQLLAPFPPPVNAISGGNVEIVWRRDSVMDWMASNPVQLCWRWPVASST